MKKNETGIGNREMVKGNFIFKFWVFELFITKIYSGIIYMILNYFFKYWVKYLNVTFHILLFQVKQWKNGLNPSLK